MAVRPTDRPTDGLLCITDCDAVGCRAVPGDGQARQSPRRRSTQSLPKDETQNTHCKTVAMFRTEAAFAIVQCAIVGSLRFRTIILSQSVAVIVIHRPERQITVFLFFSEHYLQHLSAFSNLPKSHHDVALSQ